MAADALDAGHAPVEHDLELGRVEAVVGVDVDGVVGGDAVLDAESAVVGPRVPDGTRPVTGADRRDAAGGQDDEEDERDGSGPGGHDRPTAPCRKNPALGRLRLSRGGRPVGR